MTEDKLRVSLADGGVVIAALVWFSWLFDATPLARAHGELLGDGDGIHWPDLAEDLSVAGLLAGARLTSPLP